MTDDNTPITDPEDQPTFVDADDTHDPGDQEAAKDADQLTETLAKAATDTAYATVGLVSLVSDKAKQFYEEQRRQYVVAHPEAEQAPGAQSFLAQLREHVDRLVDDLGQGFRDLAERGRNTAKDPVPEVAPAAVEPDPADPEPADLTPHTETPASPTPEAAEPDGGELSETAPGGAASGETDLPGAGIGVGSGPSGAGTFGDGPADISETDEEAYGETPETPPAHGPVADL